MSYENDERMRELLDDYMTGLAIEDYLMHYGMPRRSGRYPWGSGKEPYQHSEDFLSKIAELEAKGMSETEIAASFGGMSSTEFRLQKRIATHERRQLEVDRARSLSEDGLGPTEIARKMSPNWEGKVYNESTIRSLLTADSEANKNRAKKTAEVLKEELKTKGLIDVGDKSELALGVSAGTLDEAVYLLELEGYSRYPIGMPNVTNPKLRTKTVVLADPDVVGKDYKEGYAYVYNHPGDIQLLGDHHSADGGTTFNISRYPQSIKSDRIEINYGDQISKYTNATGTDLDGTIMIRRGIPDLDLGKSNYAQVRILVDDTHYLKGMAFYSDNMPPGKDIMYNTNKPAGTDKYKVFKGIKEDDPTNPFGAYIKADGQYTYKDKNGKEQLGAINKLREEGDWNQQAKQLSAQFVSKQPDKFIKENLNRTFKDYQARYKAINEITNPTIRRKMLEDFAGDCDSAAISLKASALPRQRTQVILPCPGLKDNEVYAPNYKNGEHVVLIRYPHGGTFEIPDLVVNNNNKAAKSMFGNAKDAISININVANKLSGADFDGDTVTVIPANTPGGKVKVVTRPSLGQLKDFDTKTAYPQTEKSKVLPKKMEQKQMGMVSNLITDMTLQNADDDEIARAVKHSMVVIDAVKHKLDYKRSEKDNDIDGLKKKYQPHANDDGYGGAQSLLSKHKQTVEVPETVGGPNRDILRETGKIVYTKQSGRTYIDKKTGEVKLATKKVNLFDTVDDLNDLSMGTTKEKLYADYGNSLKDLANQCRKESMAPKNKTVRDPIAAKTYAAEVDSIKSRLKIAQANAPLERRAEAIANQKMRVMLANNPELAEDKEHYKKQKQIAITEARQEMGVNNKDTKLHITPSEWNAIQAGALSDAMVSEVFRYADKDKLKDMAMPKNRRALTQTQRTRCRALESLGYTTEEIAAKMSVSVSTVIEVLSE